MEGTTESQVSGLALTTDLETHQDKSCQSTNPYTEGQSCQICGCSVFVLVDLRVRENRQERAEIRECAGCRSVVEDYQ
jgi:Zn-finger protein